MRDSLLFTGLASALFVHGVPAALADESPRLTIAPVSIHMAETPAKFGAADSQWLTVGVAAADDFDESLDSNIHVAYSRFLVDDVEFAVEGALWSFDQPGDDAFGISGAMVFRWHFLNRDRWTLYADVGIGGMVASDSVPDEGTSFNLMPRAGVGATYRILDNGTRLQAGLRWHHISNARLAGEERNPSRDAPMLYFGVMIPW